jgi:hypothetical protein
MPDFTHARICIRHASGSVEIQAPAGEVTWLDLSGLHALPIATGKEGRRKRRLLLTCFFLGGSAAVGGGVAFMSSSRILSPGIRAEASVLERSAPQQAFLPDMAMPNAVQASRALREPASEPAPQPAARDADPFGLRLK